MVGGEHTKQKLCQETIDWSIYVFNFYVRFSPSLFAQETEATLHYVRIAPVSRFVCGMGCAGEFISLV